MELRIYGKIIWRYIWLIVLILAIVAVYAGYQYRKLPKTTSFTSSISIQIGLVASIKGDTNPDDDLNAGTTLADTLVTGPILSSREFASDVSHQIGQDTSQIDLRYGAHPDLGDVQNLALIEGALSAVRVHSLAIVTVNWSTSAGAWAIAHAVGEVSTSHIGHYLDYVITNDYTHVSTNGSIAQPEVSARVISAASAAQAVLDSSSNKLTQLALLLLIALIVGVALAFLLNYLDDRFHTKEDVADLLLLPILAEVPQAPTPGRARPSRMHDSTAV